VIVLDEWAAGQDPHFRRVFYEASAELKARGKIVVCVTHDDRWFRPRRTGSCRMNEADSPRISPKTSAGRESPLRLPRRMHLDLAGRGAVSQSAGVSGRGIQVLESHAEAAPASCPT